MSGALMQVLVGAGRAGGAGGVGRGMLVEFCPTSINACISCCKISLVLAGFVLDGGVDQISEPKWLGWPSKCSSLV